MVLTDECLVTSFRLVISLQGFSPYFWAENSLKFFQTAGQTQKKGQDEPEKILNCSCFSEINSHLLLLF